MGVRRRPGKPLQSLQRRSSSAGWSAAAAWTCLQSAGRKTEWMKRRGNTEVPEPAANASPARSFLRERDGYLRELKPLRSAGPLTHFTRTDLTATPLHSCAFRFVVRRKCWAFFFYCFLSDWLLDAHKYSCPLPFIIQAPDIFVIL